MVYLYDACDQISDFLLKEKQKYKKMSAKKYNSKTVVFKKLTFF
jgi:hypothetical protein